MHIIKMCSTVQDHQFRMQNEAKQHRNEEKIKYDFQLFGRNCFAAKHNNPNASLKSTFHLNGIVHPFRMQSIPSKSHLMQLNNANVVDICLQPHQCYRIFFAN